MSFLIKMIVLTGFTLCVNQLAQSESLVTSYLGLFGTPEQLSNYEHDVTLRHLIRDGANPLCIEFARSSR